MPTLRKTDRKDYLSALCRTVPYHIVEAVLASPTELAISHQTYDGCIMYADVVGFSAMCERLASAGGQGLSQLSQVLDRLFELLLERGVFPFGGYVIHFGGDSMAVIFHGLDAPRRCIAAAISLQQIMYGEVGRLLGDARRELMLRIGIARGEIHLPVLGDLMRRFVVCAGDAARRALELQQLAQPDEIVADGATVLPLGSLVEAWEKQPDCYVVHNLNGWPEREAIVELLDRIEDDVEEKIALLEPFVPQPLALRLRTTPHGWRIEGELREVALLHAELTFPLEDGVPAETAVNIARSLPRTMRKYDGFLSKVDLGPNGHRALGVFGLAGPSENATERAILAAIEINSRIRGFTLDRSVAVELRIGVHFGQVYFGAIGSTHKHDIAAVGDAVNVAARTSGSAQPFEVMVTAEALEPVRQKFQHSERALLAVAGRDKPLKLHVVHGVATTRAHYAQRRRRARFLAGRGNELEQLIELADRAFGGDSRLVGLCGEAGTGKSALLSQIIDRWVEHGGLGVVGRCHYSTQSTPLAPIVTMFANFLGFTSDDSSSYRRDRIRNMLTGFGIQHGANELVALLQPVERPDGTTEALLDLADMHARERVLDAIIGFVRQRMQQEPLLYVLEDLHYADALTLQLAKRLGAFERNARFLVVATYRPEPVLAELRTTMDQELLLGTLGLEQSTELMLHELRADHIDGELARFLFERTQGNPQHLVEVLRFLTEREMIRVRAGSVVHIGNNLDLLNEAVPRTLAHLALARLDHLGEAERRLLRTAAAIGRRFKRNLLERVSASDMEPDLLESAIASLETHRVIATDDETPPGYSFRDDVIRAVAYEMIPEQERRHVHRRIADAIERIPDADTRGGAVALAMHRERSGQLADAMLWFERAIQQSAALALDREVLELVGRWEQLQSQLAAGARPGTERAARIALYKLVATARSGSPTAAIAAGRALHQSHADALDEAAWSVVDYWIGDALVALGKPEKARARLLRAYQSATDSALCSDAARLIASTYAAAQDRVATEEWLGHALQRAGSDAYRVARIEMERAHFYLFVGELEAARAIFVQVSTAAKKRGDFVTASGATTDLARCALANCDFTASRAGFEEAIGYDRALGNSAKEAFDLIHLGQALLWSGNLQAAVAPLEKGLAIASDLGNVALAAEAQVHLGLAIAFTRDPELGRAMCEEGYRGAVRSEQREVEIAADLHSLRIALLRQDRVAVVAQLERCDAHQHHLAPQVYRRAFADLQKRVHAFLTAETTSDRLAAVGPM